MHLQSLELLGFKSFADKTVFDFHEGVTAIVGPNGCGKSNVLDAVRWVLGEQSAKALRGGEMADVIFNGTDSRKPVGFGEVSLTFSNCGAELGVDWHDVRVTRRLYRDGNSEYFLNKTGCRLRDIQSLFADTGVGRSAYSIMEQGKIDLILSSRPEDRRTVFEEAAGITKYKTQKREALRKLEATEANLLRIGDIIKEVKRQIGSLQRQAGKARRYQALLGDLQVLDTHHSRRRLDELETALRDAAAEIQHHDEAERAAQNEIEANEDLLTEKRRELGKIEDEISDARAEVHRLQSAIANHRSRIEFNRQRADELTDLVQRYRADIAAAEAKRTQQATQIEEANALIEKTNRLLHTKQDELTQWTEKAAAARLERSRLESELQALNLSVSRLQDRVSHLGDELTGATSRRQASATRVEQLSAAIDDARADREGARETVAAAETAVRTEERKLELIRTEADAAETALRNHQTALSSAERAAAAAERVTAEKRSRVEILQQLNDEGEGLAAGSQALLKGLHAPEKFQPALAGALVSSLNVDREYVAALEAALGRNMHAVVLKEAKFAPEIVRVLREGKLGQAALALPMLAGDAPDIPDNELPKGTLGWAIDKIEMPEAVNALVRRLLRAVAVVADLETALRLKQAAPALQFATLAGEFVSAEGVVFGGEGNAQSDSLLRRKARIESLLEEEAAVVAEHSDLIRQVGSVRNAMDSAVASLEKIREGHQATQLNHSTAQAQFAVTQRGLHEAERKVELLEIERATLVQQLEAADAQIGALQKEIDAQKMALLRNNTRHTESAQALATARSAEEEAAAAFDEVRLAVATERQRHENLMSQRQPMTAREAELAELIAARRADVANYEARLLAQAEESRTAEAEVGKQSAEATSAEERVAKISEQRAERLTAVAELETKLRALRHSLNERHDLRGKQQVRSTQIQLQVENLGEHISRRYQIDLRDFKSDPYAFNKTLRVQLKRRSKPAEPFAPEGETEARLPENAEPAAPDAPGAEPIEAQEIERVIAELTHQLDNMGPVNLDAVQEYDELEERHQFLETQNNDLTASRKELLDVIARINSTTQKLFAETFAQIRVNFREMFAELFGGGRADLTLVDETDPLNCGIDIIAKPPGKQLQSVSLLSGGERTMTAVALLFAIYMVRPSPFCILDEMDAPLDESNINRFIKMLDRFVDQSQFIIITHNKRTIAQADILYGVTMEERGVSKLVAMKLTPERGSDGELRKGERKPLMQPQFPAAGAEQERELALSR
ncbi:MAG: chromosome segregation protein SMC [Chthoniobacterales bacterium]